MRSNCIFFAYALRWRPWCKLRRDKKRNPGLKRPRGYVLWCKSDWGIFLHCLYGQNTRSGMVRLVSYKPIAPRKRLLPPPLFSGRVKWGD
jgi:hypothetical protein